MTPHEILRDLDAIGAVLVAKPPDGKLFVRAPKGVISRELVDEISAHKEELRLILFNQTNATNPAPLSSGDRTPPDTGAAQVQDEIQRWIQVFGATVAKPSSIRPTPLRPITLIYGGESVRFVLALHNMSGANRFGQSAAENPYCVLNVAAWRENLYDLTLIRWYPSAAAALAVGAEQPRALESHDANDNRTCATFPRQVRVELRHEGGSRWLMWVKKDGYEERRKDFASPHLDHARRTAEAWYGTPVEGWQPEQADRD